ncbi:M3 family oligoendopeptidase [Bacillaceae bacterium SIJ1]|uniref:M3 family oligoendopeptidase n=1 Tax=Litoribacterium kuwaitense TaxID=1398745 RepID=UPI0013ED74C3|nr:M3 family oligoendopeptidase [Litoribacterium kuwaitense]NGP44279.1 M3 family oligoendopeptidase [Litoribacterium kuwaitense]
MQQTWELDSIFSGGSDSTAFRDFLTTLETDLQQFSESVQSWDSKDSNDLLQLIDEMSHVVLSLREASAYVSCLLAQNTTDQGAKQLQDRLSSIAVKVKNANTAFESKIAKVDETMWNTWMDSEAFSEMSFYLNEKREQSSSTLPEAEEELINALSVDGYQGWGQMYQVLVQSIRIPVDDNGQEKLLSAGQAANKMVSADAHVRNQVFSAWEQAWADKGQLFAETLNHLSGFRLQVYKARGWNDVMYESLQRNRMKKETLTAMWSAIAKHKQPFVDYLHRKAKLLGKDKLEWQDVEAPLGENDNHIPYAQGGKMIITQFESFGSTLAAFAETAFANCWIEAEDRDNKRPGGFCTTFGLSKESRIFMTYSGTMSNVSTLAHELGHAFHNYALRDVHPFRRWYAMNVAETASTFAEQIVHNAAIKHAKTKEEQIALLDDKLQRSVAFFMNIHARYLFETRFYEVRSQGMVPYKKINDLMVDAQQEAFAGALASYHPHFWASKLHFYMTGVPFYNYPYTFGYLFSLGIYAQAQQEGKSFEQKYIALLQDTASMSVEDLAAKHLGADITTEAFWEQGISLTLTDVEAFMELTAAEPKHS